jgi:methyl-accepting chemotaxis protein
MLVVPALAIGWFSFQAAQSQVKSEVTSSAISGVTLFDQSLTNFFTQQEENVNFLAYNVDSVLSSGNKQILRDELQNFYTSHDDLILRAFVATDKGAYVQRPVSSSQGAEFDPTKTDWYQEAKNAGGSLVIGEPHFDSTSNNYVITVSRALPNGDGVIGLDLLAEPVMKMAQSVKIGQSGYLAVFTDGRMVVSDKGHKIGSAVTDAGLQPLFQSKSGQFTYVANGVQQHIGFTTNSMTGWKIAAVILPQEYTDAVAPIRNATILDIAIALVLGVVLMWFVVRSITKPLNWLIAAARQIGAGDLTERILVNRRDELGQLAQSFNQMAESLQSIIADVSQTAQQVSASAEQLTASAEENSRATEQVTLTVQETATGMERQAQIVEQNRQTVERMTAGMQEIAAASQQVATAAQDASTVASHGNHAIDSVVEQMRSIQRQVDQLAEVIQGLGERSREIGDIVEVITNISDQTNLLALNAAIEAARAGEMGRGFAVVADEVRKLAEQAAESAKQITDLIHSIQGETKRAVDSMAESMQVVGQGMQTVSRAGESFEQIRAAVDSVAQQIEEVSQALARMSEGAKQFREGMDGVAAVTESTSAGMQTVAASAQEQLASMEEITASAGALSEMAEQLQDRIARFKV